MQPLWRYTYCKYCVDKYGQFNTAHYLIECPITSKNCQYVREMLNDDELDVDITSQGDIVYSGPASIGIRCSC